MTQSERAMGVETELKFRLPASDLESLANGQVPGGTIGERQESDLVSTYFDTARHKLRRHGLTLRVRQTGGKHIQTIKSASGPQFGRGQWETEINAGTPDLTKCRGTPLERLASKELRDKLRPLFETSVHRIMLPLSVGKSEIELAMDRGTLVAGCRSAPIEELELELKAGRPDDLFRIAKAVERKSAAELYLRTKPERGYDLAGGKDDRAAYNEPIELMKNSKTGDAFQAIARSTVRHFWGNADAIRNGDPEGIHQMRVGLRRLRAAISIFSKLLPAAKTEEIKAELRWLTNELASAREIDVFVNEKITPIARDLVPRGGGEALQREFAARRATALERAKNAIDSERCRALLVDVLEWIEIKHGLSESDASIPIGTFAHHVLRRRIRKLGKEGRKLESLPPRERHKFRIRIKKVRYGVEFFESLFVKRREQKKLARLSKHLKKIQDALGSLNDLIAHRKLATDVALNAAPQNRRARAFASGIVLGREDEAVRGLMKIAVREVRKIRKATVFDRTRHHRFGSLFIGRI
jgi:inorganic triphosphatase YgiF